MEASSVPLNSFESVKLSQTSRWSVFVIGHRCLVAFQFFNEPDCKPVYEVQVTRLDQSLKNYPLHKTTVFLLIVMAGSKEGLIWRHLVSEIQLFIPLSC